MLIIGSLARIKWVWINRYTLGLCIFLICKRNILRNCLCFVNMFPNIMKYKQMSPWLFTWELITKYNENKIGTKVDYFNLPFASTSLNRDWVVGGGITIVLSIKWNICWVLPHHGGSGAGGGTRGRQRAWHFSDGWETFAIVKWRNFQSDCRKTMIRSFSRVLSLANILLLSSIRFFWIERIEYTDHYLRSIATFFFCSILWGWVKGKKTSIWSVRCWKRCWIS